MYSDCSLEGCVVGKKKGAFQRLSVIPKGLFASLMSSSQAPRFKPSNAFV